MARVEHVIGEFYWKVTTEEMAHTADFISPPLMLSKEVSLPAGPGDESPEVEQPKQTKRKKRKDPGFESGEINWSLGAYVKRQDVEKAFGIQGLPKPSKVAPNQLFPHKAVYKYWLLLLILTIRVRDGVVATGSRTKVFEQTFQFEALKAADGTQVVFTEPFQMEGGKNIKIAARGT